MGDQISCKQCELSKICLMDFFSYLLKHATGLADGSSSACCVLTFLIEGHGLNPLM